MGVGNMNLTEVNFKIIDERLAKAVVIQKHYLHRPPPISFAYGAYIEGDRKTKGVLTVGKPCSPTVCEGVCGKDRAKDVFELNRLWMDDALPETVTDSTGKVHSAGYESRFIGWCLRELRGSYPNLILVSYADTRQRHVGTVYQATNWTYTGTSTPFKDKVGERSIERSTKHRYVWFSNTADRMSLRWKELPYPKRPEAAVSRTGDEEVNPAQLGQQTES